jgi:cysteine desulfurase/selenocysteine lyase
VTARGAFATGVTPDAPARPAGVEETPPSAVTGADVAVSPLHGRRADFPTLARVQDGRPLTYLDSAATAQKPYAVIDEIDDYLRRSNASVHRGVYRLAEESTERFEGARGRIAAAYGGQPATTIFTHNATAAINLVAYAWGREHVGPGDEVLLTEMEHHSNIVPWQLLCAERGARLRYLSVSDSGELSLDELDAVLADGRVKLVGVVHVSNVLGTINPVREIAARARAAGAACLVDGSQAAAQMPVDVAAIDADFYAWTGHKALGPTGVGVLHGRRAVLEAMRPFIGGGHMISSVGLEESTWNELPWKFEAGTSAIAEVIGLGAAIDYLSALGYGAVREHERDLTGYALERLAEVPGLALHGPLDPDRRGGVVSFAIDGVHPHDVAEICDRHAICIRAGHHCAQPLMRRLGVGATARASFHVYNEREDIDRLVEALGEVRRVFGLD